AHALKRVVPCERIGVAVIGLEVPHTHIHLMPVRTVSDLSFGKTPVDMTPDAFRLLAAEIAATM
ncbi:MAG: hypothetical protein RL742_407, partial [Bacteroidota bacterium]